MGNGCSSLTKEDEEIQKQVSLSSQIMKNKFQELGTVPASELTQIEIPNAMLHSPSKPKIQFDNLHTSKVRVPSEESQFQKQFIISKEFQKINSSRKHAETTKKPSRKSSLKKNQKEQQKEDSSVQYSFSPKKTRQTYDKYHSPLVQNIELCCGSQSKRRRTQSIPKRSKGYDQEMRAQAQYGSRRKYSDLPIKSEVKTQVRRKISNNLDDYNYIIGVDTQALQKTYTPSPILKHKDSFSDNNSPQKKNVRFNETTTRSKKQGYLN